MDKNKFLLHAMHTRRRSFRQMLQFTFVGVIATATHASLFIFILENKITSALQANFIAFIVAFLISFLGQYHWTFKNTGVSHWLRKLVKFFIISLIGLSINAGAVYLIVNVAFLPYAYSVVVMTTITPAMTFLINKKWTFT
ncbi:GtrA family protein [Methylomonas sp. MgM2]